MNEELSDQINKQSLEKIELEKKKLKREILAQKLFFLQPAFLAPVAAILLAIITYNSGIFDSKKSLLESQRALLQLDIETNVKRKDSLDRLIASLEHDKSHLNLQNKRLSQTADSLKARFNLFTGKYLAEKKSIVSSLLEIDQLLGAGKTAEANTKLQAVVRKLNNITKRDFSDDFSNDFR